MSIATDVIHAERYVDPTTGSHVTPIYQKIGRASCRERV